MTQIHIPAKLYRTIQQEKVALIKKTQRAYPLVKALSTIGSALFLIVVIGSAFYFGNFKTVKIDTFSSLFSVSFWKATGDIGFLFGFFLIGALSFLVFGVYQLLKKGYYFVATPTRFILFRNGKSQAYHWKEFNGSITIKKNKNNANISFELGAKYCVLNMYYVPKKIEMININEYIKVVNSCSELMLKNNI